MHRKVTSWKSKRVISLWPGWLPLIKGMQFSFERNCRRRDTTSSGVFSCILATEGFYDCWCRLFVGLIFDLDKNWKRSKKELPSHLAVNSLCWCGQDMHKCSMWSLKARANPISALHYQFSSWEPLRFSSERFVLILWHLITTSWLWCFHNKFCSWCKWSECTLWSGVNCEVCVRVPVRAVDSHGRLDEFGAAERSEMFSVAVRRNNCIPTQKRTVKKSATPSFLLLAFWQGARIGVVSEL